MLAKHPDKCRFPHGHTRKVEFVLESDRLDASDMVCDFKVIKEMMGEFLERYDHALCMNTEDPKYQDLRATYGERIIPFEAVDPTTEVLAEAVYRHCVEQLAAYRARPEQRYPIAPQVRLVKVRVWETSSSWAEYWE